MNPTPFPVALRLEGRSVLVVGSGEVALARVARLREAGAIVRVVEAIDFVPSDVQGAWLVFASTDNANRDAEVFAACEVRGILCNAMDQPSACSFFLMSEAQLGNVTLAVGTGGTAPGLTGRLRREARAGLPEDIADLVHAYAAVRKNLYENKDIELPTRRALLRWLAAQPWPFFRQPLDQQLRQLTQHWSAPG